MAEDYPKFQMLSGNKLENESWLELRRAGAMFDNGWIRVKIGGKALEETGQVRPITEEERSEIVRVADEYSESK